MSQVSRIALRRCSQNDLVFVIVFVFVFVFVNVFGHVMSSHHSEQMSQSSKVFRICQGVTKTYKWWDERQKINYEANNDRNLIKLTTHYLYRYQIQV